MISQIAKEVDKAINGAMSNADTKPINPYVGSPLNSIGLIPARDNKPKIKNITK